VGAIGGRKGDFWNTMTKKKKRGFVTRDGGVPSMRELGAARRRKGRFDFSATEWGDRGEKVEMI